MSLAITVRTAVILVILARLAQAFLPANQSCCLSLQRSLPGVVSFNGSSAYIESVRSYWAEQETYTRPQCVVSVQTIEHVRKAVETLSYLNARSVICPLAVHAGGHGRSGSSNQQDGVDIDLRALNSTTLSADKETAQIGVGAHWLDVARALESMNRAVPGGRNGDVGVGGLALAGGISYFAPSVGFSCDNILEYEVVLSNGKIVHASAYSHPELFKALRGGTNNFGIVTRVKYQTFPLQKIWGGNTYYDMSTYAAQIKAFYDFTSNANYDERAYIYQSFGHSPEASAAINNIVYSKPVPELPATLKALNESTPMLFSTLRIANLSEIMVEQTSGSPHGFRQITYTTTFHLNQEMLEASFKIWNASVAAVREVANISYSWTFEPFPRRLLVESARRGGNMLGLPTNSSLVLGQLAASYLNAADDTLMWRLSKQVLTDIEGEAKRLGVYHPWKYAGYAAQDQPVTEGYGKKNVHFMKRVSQHYDPTQFFQRAVPGGFKLDV